MVMRNNIEASEIKNITKLRCFRFIDGKGEASCTFCRSVVRELRVREDKSEIEAQDYELFALDKAILGDLEKQYRCIDDESRLDLTNGPTNSCD